MAEINETPQQEPGSAKHTASGTTTTTKTAGAKTTAKASTAQERSAIERAVALPIGATLVVRDDVLSSIRKMSKKYGTTSGREKELTRFEKRGLRACSKVERQVKRQRKQFERDLRARRKQVEHDLRERRKQVEGHANTVGKRFESQAATATAAVDGVTNRIEGLVSSAQGMIRQPANPPENES